MMNFDIYANDLYVTKLKTFLTTSMSNEIELPTLGRKVYFLSASKVWRPQVYLVYCFHSFPINSGEDKHSN